MAENANVHVHHVTRVEGHGDITARIRHGRLEEVRFAVVEAPRFFEAFLRGQDVHEVVHIASRICGICAVSHRSAALQAAENALDVTVSPQTRLLRRLAFHGEVLSSHILHLYFLAAPDFFGVDSVFPLVDTHKETVLRAMRLKKLAYDLCAAVAGRHTHPVGMVVGGFTFTHSPERLAAMRERLVEGAQDIKETVRLFKTFDFPEFERETEYVSLRHPDHYAFYEGHVASSEGEETAPEMYREVLEEYVVPYSTAKYARWHRPAYMVGALARVNNNHGQLSPLAREAAQELGLGFPCFNPFMITVAQLVESAHCLEESIELIDEILEAGIQADQESARVDVRQGRGVGAVEAPRGILFHDYELNAQGACLSANLVIPTAQNLANLEADMRELTPRIIHKDQESITRELEMLVRAYDPCISCSTHMVEIDFGDMRGTGL